MRRADMHLSQVQAPQADRDRWLALSWISCRCPCSAHARTCLALFLPLPHPCRLASVESFASKFIPVIQSRLTKANAGAQIKGKAVEYPVLVWDMLSFFTAHCGPSLHALLKTAIMFECHPLSFYFRIVCSLCLFVPLTFLLLAPISRQPAARHAAVLLMHSRSCWTKSQPLSRSRASLFSVYQQQAVLQEMWQNSEESSPLARTRILREQLRYAPATCRPERIWK